MCTIIHVWCPSHSNRWNVLLTDILQGTCVNVKILLEAVRHSELVDAQQMEPHLIHTIFKTYFASRMINVMEQVTWLYIFHLELGKSSVCSITCIIHSETLFHIKSFWNPFPSIKPILSKTINTDWNNSFLFAWEMDRFTGKFVFCSQGRYSPLQTEGCYLCVEGYDFIPYWLYQQTI